MTRFRKGERVNVTIRDGRVADSFYSGQSGEVLIVVVEDSPSNERSMAINLAAPSVTVERVIPEFWPPVVGDIWEDRDGRRWLAQNRPGGLRLIPVALGEDDDPLLVDLPSHFLNYSGPVQLVCRTDAPF